MSSITALNSPVTNPYSSAAPRAAGEEEEDKKTTGAEDADKTEEPALSEEEQKTLGGYKREFLAKVKSMMASPHLSQVGLELDITDAGFSRMMRDPGYEKALLDQLREKTAHNYNRQAGTVKLSADGTKDPEALMASAKSVSEILFSTSSSRAMLRTLDIDSMTMMAEETIAAVGGGGTGRFSMAGTLGAMQMRSANSYIDQYIKSLGAVDTTG